jgi:Ferritin-like domain
VTRLSRTQFLSRTAKGGIAFTVSGGALGAGASPAVAAVGQGDVPVVMLAVAAELLGAELYTQLLAAKLFTAHEQRAFERARFNEGEHYAALAKTLADAGQTPAQAGDFDFTFPRGTFSTRNKAARLGMELETIFLGVYLGGVPSLLDSVTRSVFARIAANQAEHLSLFTRIGLDKPIGPSFPLGLSLEEASVALDPFVS